MNAAVVHSFDHPPRYENCDDPHPAAGHDVVVDILAAGLHPRVRSGADGSRYTSEGELPLIPGIDGVGRGPDGELLYFVLPDTPRGSMAERCVVDRRLPLPSAALRAANLRIMGSGQGSVPTAAIVAAPASRRRDQRRQLHRRRRRPSVQ